MNCEDCYTLTGLQVGWIILGTVIFTVVVMRLFASLIDLTQHDKKGDFKL